ncbi:hypothetical protein NDA18_001378 [Ustilago nuda]|nr:hypothetical protein NDA18_001378 [Ustilago nuda]
MSGAASNIYSLSTSNQSRIINRLPRKFLCHTAHNISCYESAAIVLPTSIVPFRQDLPPSGGYQPIRYKRNLPGKNLSGLTMFGGVIAICAYGFYKVGLGNLEKRELKRERAWSRIHLIPLLMAESDRDAYRRNEAQIAREKEIMKDVPGWEAGKSVYNTKKYTAPNFIVL